jgi:hypothetical protein
VLLGGTARAGTDDEATTGDDPAAQPAPSAQVTGGMGTGTGADETAHAQVKEGDPVRTSADPGSGGGIEMRAAPVGQPGSGRDDASEVAAGNSGGRG